MNCWVKVSWSNNIFVNNGEKSVLLCFLAVHNINFPYYVIWPHGKWILSLRKHMETCILVAFMNTKMIRISRSSYVCHVNNFVIIFSVYFLFVGRLVDFATCHPLICHARFGLSGFFGFKRNLSLPFVGLVAFLWVLDLAVVALPAPMKPCRGCSDAFRPQTWHLMMKLEWPELFVGLGLTWFLFMCGDRGWGFSESGEPCSFWLFYPIPLQRDFDPGGWS